MEEILQILIDTYGKSEIIEKLKTMNITYQFEHYEFPFGEISVRLENCLNSEKIRTINDAYVFCEGKLLNFMKIKNFGAITMVELCNEIARRECLNKFEVYLNDKMIKEANRYPYRYTFLHKSIKLNNK